MLHFGSLAGSFLIVLLLYEAGMFILRVDGSSLYLLNNEENEQNLTLFTFIFTLKVIGRLVSALL